MERFLFEVIGPLLSPDLPQQRREEYLKTVGEQLRFFIKGELGPINKELSKKSRELFVASADVETLKEEVEALKREMNSLRGQLAAKENELVKQRMVFQRDEADLNAQLAAVRQQLKQKEKEFKQDLQRCNDEWKERLFEEKRVQRMSFEAKAETERKDWEEQTNQTLETHSKEKQHMMEESNKEKSRLIKKYEEKIYKINSDNDDNVQRMTKAHQAQVNDLTSQRSQLRGKLMAEETNSRRLGMELEKETNAHNRFRRQFDSTFKELQANKMRNLSETERMNYEIDQLNCKYKDMEKKLNGKIKQLQKELADTIKAKDKKFTDTVEEMNTVHRVEVDSLFNRLTEDKEQALSSAEVKAYQEMFQQMKKYQQLEWQFRQLKESHQQVAERYQKEISTLQSEHELELTALQERKEYETTLTDENAKREHRNITNKFGLEIAAMRTAHTSEIDGLLRRGQEEKIALSNRLTQQYEGMLADQRNNTDIQIKQKLIEFERKAKAYEKRVGEGEKRKAELKGAMERMKLELQMKVESMIEVNEKLEGDIEELQDRVLQLEKEKATLVNDYEFKLLLAGNEMEELKEKHAEKEQQLRDTLNQHIIHKNREITRLTERLKKETAQLISSNNETVTALGKEYSQLQRVMAQRTSLPEDIDTLRTFHAAYLAKEAELEAEMRKRQLLQRELHSKDAIEKVFTAKEAFKKMTILDKVAGGKAGIRLGSNIGQSHRK